VVSERPGVVRSYQRVFRPDRRIHAIDGRALPIPGGLPLRWLAAAAIAALAVLLLGAMSAPLMIAIAGASAGWVRRLGRRHLAIAAAASGAVGCAVLGLLLNLMDWAVALGSGTLALSREGTVASGSLGRSQRARYRGREAYRRLVSGASHVLDPLQAASDDGREAREPSSELLRPGS
jgi:hypothetical protein